MKDMSYSVHLKSTSQTSLMVTILAWLVCCTPALVAKSSGIIKKTPTIVSNTLLRGDVGVFGAPRAGGKSHVGVDIVANQLSSDKSVYSVRAVREGIVAYANFNGENAEEGYGYTVVLDHGDGTYTLYAHLATLASSGLVKVSDSVTAGQTIGYMADPANNEMSSGNVLGPSVKKWDKIQLHFEEFQAPSGRKSTTDISQKIKNGAMTLDPTSDLTSNGYTQ